MDKKQASSIIKGAFGSVFDKDKFIGFVGNLLNLNSADYLHRNIGIYDTYKQHVQSLEVVAKFSDGNKNEIDVLIVTLIRDTSLDKARTMQRNFVARYLSEKQGDAALVAFTSPDAEDWRFSLIKMDLGFKRTNTGIKVEQEFTPAKRWSFLVGKNENSHTAQSQLVDILANDENEPMLEELEQAFSIETVTNEFYEKYTELFHRIKEALDILLENDSQLKSDFEIKEVDTADFAKKTMGQMAFLYFLQKKGWFGVEPGKEWGTGAKKFLRKLFENRKDNENFFDDVLEPLFYEALAKDRGNDANYYRLDCRMPFLNGGLFEPMTGDSWETTHIRLPNELFSNDTETKEGDAGDGILDVFDRYNFTVNESEPLEQEVAVDPEMLGKVFENLLEIKDRKSEGAFYTRREIVHYMCQESLINYLETETNNLIPKTDIELFIQQGSQITQNDKSIIEQGSDRGNLLLPQSVSEQASNLDDLLANIKVCDPAVGSGAFPLGMLNEIVTARTILGIHLKNGTSAYNLKLHAISNSIYGVDINPGAVEIAKLRFWLSLVVEEDNPIPLPNLEHKIMQGNSLVSQYEGIELFNDDFLNSAESINDEKNDIQEKLNEIQKEYFSLHSTGEFTTDRKAEVEEEIKRLQRRLKFLNNKNTTTTETGSLFDAPQVKKIAQQKAKLLQSKIAQYVTVDSQTPKENLKKEIENLKWDLIEATLEERGKNDKLGEIKKLRKERVKPFFIWKLEFGDIFKDNGGFDVVIGNPPYVDSETMVKNGDKEYRQEICQIYGSIKGNWDLFIPFIHQGMLLNNANGILAFIIPNKLISQDYAKTTRELILSNSIVEIRDYSRIKIFVNADVYPITLVIKKNNSGQNIAKMTKMKNINEVSCGNFINAEKLTSENWDMYFLDKNSISIVEKINSNKCTLEKLAAFQSPCTVSEAYLFKEVITDDNIEKSKKFINSGAIDKYTSLWGIKDIQYIKGKYEYPVILDDDIGYISKKRLLQSNSQKIIIANMTKEIEAFFDYQRKYIAGKSTTICIGNENDLKTVLSLLNSKLVSYWYKITFHSGKMSGGALSISQNKLKIIPLPKISTNSRQSFIELIDKIIFNKECNENTTDLEGEIDQLVYQLYDLTDEEIAIVEKSI
jgi:methylase of polypeptide subunit release factors